MKVVLPLVLAGFVTLPTYAAEVRIQMPQGEGLVLSLPNGWSGQTRPTIPGQPDTARITSSEPGKLLILVSAILPFKEGVPVPTDASTFAAVQRAAAAAKPKALESALQVKNLPVAGAFAYYFTATDKNPGPDEFKYLAQGQIGLNEVTVVFTVLMNGDPQVLTEEALRVMRSIRRDSPNAMAIVVTETPLRYQLTVPVSRLTMSIPKAGLAPAATPSTGGSTASPRYFRFDGGGGNLVVSGWFESAGGFTSVQQIWSGEVAAWQRTGAPLPVNVSFLRLGDWDAVRYEVTVPAGHACHLRAHRVQAGTWIDLHLSASGTVSRSELEEILERLLTDIHVSEKG